MSATTLNAVVDYCCKHEDGAILESGLFSKICIQVNIRLKKIIHSFLQCYNSFLSMFYGAYRDLEVSINVSIY